MISSNVTAMVRSGLQMGGLCLVGVVDQEGFETNKANPSSLCILMVAFV